MLNKDLYYEIYNLIRLKQEEYWILKGSVTTTQENYCHDIICMANNLIEHNGYIIIGVDEESDYQSVNVLNDINSLNTQKIVDLIYLYVYDRFKMYLKRTDCN